MINFDFLKGKSDASAPDEHRVALGADATPSGAPSAGNPAIAAARAEAKAGLETATRRRGRPPQNTPTGGGNTSAVPSAELAAEMQRQLEQCLDPKPWGALLASPADVMTVISDKPENWRVTKDERETLGACGSAFARTMMVQNPRSLALLMLSSALFATYVPRLIAEAKHRKEKAAQPAPGKTP